MRPELLFVLAFALYSLAIWSHWTTREFSNGIIAVFALGLTADILATSWCFGLADGFSWSLHAMLGIVAVAIMGIHFSWALLARTQGGRFESYFLHCSRPAWVLWIASCLSGIPLTHA